MREKEIARLLQKSEKRLKIAKEYFEKDDYEIVISEAYFSMFYCACALLLTKNLAFSKHSAVIAAFGQYFSKTGEVDPVLHRLLINAEEKRKKSDYLYMEEITKEEAEKVLKDAEYFLSEIKKKLQDYLR